MIYGGIVALLVLIDQAIKYIVVTNMSENMVIQVIHGLLSFTYIKNFGIAFGMFQNKVLFFSVVTSLIAAVIVYLIYKFQTQSKAAAYCLALILGGALGNIIDRIRLGYVVDYISVSFFPPIFNFADCCVVVGSIVLCLLVLFDKSLLEDGKR